MPRRKLDWQPARERLAKMAADLAALKLRGTAFAGQAAHIEWTRRYYQENERSPELYRAIMRSGRA